MYAGAGTTCVALAFANFLCSKQGMKTAYIELNTTNQICSLHPNTKKTPFSFMGITIYPSLKATSLWDVLRMDYDYFILDMGVLNAYTATEFSKCHQQFLVCNFSEWKYKYTIEKVEQFFQNTKLSQDCVTVLSNFGIKKSTLSTFFNCHLKLCTFPFIQNPFQLEPIVFKHFTKLLERNIV